MAKIDNIKTDNVEALLNKIMGGFIVCNYDVESQSSCVEYINNGWTTITGYTKEELIREKGGNPQALVLSEDIDKTNVEYMEQLRHGDTYELMYRIVHKNGEVRWVIDKGVVTQLLDNIMQNQSIITDVTRLKEQEERLQTLAEIDRLTGLHNKASFEQLARQALHQSEGLCALAILDIDNFKGINDTFGHAAGDMALQEVAKRLKNVLDSQNIQGRIGGDEFSVLISDLPDIAAAAQTAGDICAAMRDASLTEREITLTVSVGVAFSQQSSNYTDFFNRADAALYKAKKNGKNQYALEESVE